MNTKTMRLPPRRVLTPSATTNKRKERDDPFDRPKPIPTPPKLVKPDRPASEPISANNTNTNTKSKAGFDWKPSNQLLAGYLAHEFLTRGTLLGQPPKGKSSEESGGEEGEAAAAATTAWRKSEEERERYAEVAGLLKGGGTQLPGVVNPTQLARFLHL